MSDYKKKYAMSKIIHLSLFNVSEIVLFNDTFVFNKDAMGEVVLSV